MVAPVRQARRADDSFPSAGGSGKFDKNNKKQFVDQHDDKNKKFLSRTHNKPDESEFQDKIAGINKVIDGLRLKIRGIKEQMNSTTGGNKQFNEAKDELRKKLDEVQAHIDNLEKQRAGLIEKIEKAQNEGKQMKSSVQSMKKSLNLSSEKEISERIKSIEAKIMTETMSLKDEKKLMAEISQLKASRTQVTKMLALANVAQDYEGKSVVPIKMQLDQVTSELKEARGVKYGISEKYKKLIGDRQQEMEPLKDLFKARETLVKKLEEEIAKKNELYDEFNAAMNIWRTHQAQVREARFERIRSEKERKALEQQKQQLEKELESMEDTPLESELLLREQTIQYVKKLMDERKARMSAMDADEPNENEVLEALAADNALLPKNQRKQEFFFAPKKNMTKKTTPKKPLKPYVFKHDINTLSYFEQCGVTAPTVDDDLDNCYQSLLSNCEEFKKKQQSELSQNSQKRIDVEEQIKALELKLAQLAIVPPENLISSDAPVKVE